MKYPLYGSHNSATTPTAGAVRYMPYHNGSTTLYASNSQANQLVSESMNLSNFIVTLQVPPGTGKSWNLTVMKNGVATLMSVTISDTNTIGSYTATVISFAAGDKIAIRSTPSGTPDFSSGLSWNSTAESTNQVVLGKTNASFGAANNFVPFSGTGGSGSSGTEGVVTMVIPTAGTFSNLYVGVDTAPGAGTSKIFTVIKNGVATAVTATIADTNNTGNDLTHNFSVVAGDTVSMAINFSGAPATIYHSWGISFAPTVAGESFHGVWPGALLDTASTSYALFPHKVSYVLTDDFNIRLVIGAWRFKTIYMKTITASGAGKSYTAVLRKNAADTALSVTATNTTTPQGASTNVDTVQGDLVNIAVTPNSTPTASRVPVSFTVVEIPVTNKGSTLMTMGVG